MKFRTELAAPSFPFQLNYSKRMVFMGSCFAENIGERFEAARFNASINPYGILFNPVSLFQTLEEALHQSVPDESNLLKNGELHYSWNHHSILHAEDPDDLIREIHRINRSTYAQLKSCHVLFITLGTSWAFRHLERNKIVANCHKQAQNLFVKELIPAEEIERRFKQVHDLLLEENPDVKIVFTASPVRYVRDGLVESNRSKAELIRAVHNLVGSYNNCFYLPAYEWVIDDLRDYRYFDKDLSHPNSLAVDYVWEKVQTSLLEKSTLQQMDEVKAFFAGVNHRPFQANSEEHQKFLIRLRDKGLKLQEELGLNLRYELHQIESQIHH